METEPDRTSQEIVRADAERILSAAFGTVRLDAGAPLDISDSSGRSNLCRFQVLDGPAGISASVVVKQAVAMGDESWDPDRPGGPASRLFSEWASLQFLGEVVPDLPVAPRLYGGDRDAGILVMEDRGPMADGLTEWLLGDDPAAAETDLVAYAATVRRMHGATAGDIARHDELRGALGHSDAGLDQDWMKPTFHATLDALGLTPVPSIDDDLAVIEAAIGSPGDFAALIHSDPCPGNWLRTGTSDRLLDFEFAGVGHALLDGVYGHVPFPTCWCIGRLPEHVTQTMERAYRVEFARGCPAARNDARYAQAVANACAYWLVDLCLRSPMPMLLEEDFEWGTATIRQRLLVRLDVVIQVTRESGHLEALGDQAKAIARTLHDRWDPIVAPLPLYHAFQPA